MKATSEKFCGENDNQEIRTSLKARSINGGGVLAATQGIKFLFTFLSAAVLGRLLKPEDFGLVMMVTAVTGFLVLFRDFGLSMATIQKEDISDDQLSAMFWLNTAISIFLAIVICCSAPFIVAFYDEARLFPIACTYSVVAIIGGLSIQHGAILRRRLKFEIVSMTSLVGFVIAQLVAILVAATTKSYWALVCIPVVESTVTLVSFWWNCSWRPKIPKKDTPVRKLLGFGANVSVSSAVNYFGRNADNMLVGWRLGSDSLGLYSKAYSLLMLPIRQVNAPVSSVAIPALSRLQNEPARYRRAYLKILEQLLIITVPGIVALFCVSDWVISIVLGPQWDESVAVFKWLAIAGLTQPLSNALGWVFVTQDRTNELVPWTVFSTLVSVSSFVVGINWGIEGVAAVYAITGLLIRSPALIWWSCRKGPVRIEDICRVLTAPVFVGGMIGAAIGLYRLYASNPYAGITVCGAIAPVVWLLSLGSFARGRAILEDLRQMMHSVKDRIRGSS